MKTVTKRGEREKRHRRIRERVSGTSQQPRLCAFRSGKHTYAQIIDDTKGYSLVHASTLDAEVSTVKEKGLKKAELVGQLIAKRARAKGIKRIVFDRGGYKYHGRVRAVAEGARAGGLEF